MKIYIELVVFFILMFIFLSWSYWLKWSRDRLIKKYDPSKDKGRKYEEAVI